MENGISFEFPFGRRRSGDGDCARNKCYQMSRCSSHEDSPPLLHSLMPLILESVVPCRPRATQQETLSSCKSLRFLSQLPSFAVGIFCVGLDSWPAM